MTDAERLKLALALLEDKDFIQAKADYNRGHLSYANWLNERTKGLYEPVASPALPPEVVALIEAARAVAGMTMGNRDVAMFLLNELRGALTPFDRTEKTS